jgi:cytochrome c biogenesis protein CcmG/thiol:disulfide interchange protein DsbE
MATVTETSQRRQHRWLFLLPVALFALVGLLLGLGLTRDPTALPSAMLGKPVPVFDLQPIPGYASPGLSSEDLKNGPVLVSVFASWCVPCRVEHPLLERLAAEGVTIYGIDYKDKPADIIKWLGEMGDPFKKIGADITGRVAIEWGVYGVPETYVIDREGRIALRHVGPLMPFEVDEQILPLLKKLAG